MSTLMIISRLMSKDNIKIALGIIILLLVMAVVILSMRWRAAHKEKERVISNIAAMSTETKILLNNDSITIAEKDRLLLTQDEIIDNQDLSIQALVSNLKSNNIKLKNTESALFAQIVLNKSLKSKVTIDTVYSELSLDSIPQMNLVERDTASIGSLQIIRAYVLGADSADYKVSYSPKVYVTISTYKDGKWKVKNIWKWRTKVTKATVNTDDKFFSPTEVLYIESL